MITVVEGPSAAGKTTWARRHGSILVEEVSPIASPPAGVAMAARFWADAGAARWAEALRTERRSGTAVCDTDPLKLHYAWSLYRVGAASAVQLREQAAAYRSHVADGRLGFADHYFVSVPDEATLAARKAADGSRRRHNFDLHRLLGGPLQEWYAALEIARPGSVTWRLPDAGLDGMPTVLRSRYDLPAFDTIVNRLWELAPESR